MTPAVRRLALLPVLAAAAAGTGAGLAFPPTAWQPLMPVGLAVFGWLAAGCRLRRGLLLGYAFGVGYYGVLIRWLAVVGVWPTVGLVLLMACWTALLGAALALAGRWPVWPLTGAAAWTAVEFAASRWPLGGFPWGRLGFAAASTPIDGWFPLLGTSGVSFLIAATSLSVAWAMRLLPFRRLANLAPRLRAVVAPRVGGEGETRELQEGLAPVEEEVAPRAGGEGKTRLTGREPAGPSALAAPAKAGAASARRRGWTETARLAPAPAKRLAWAGTGFVLVGLGGWAGSCYDPPPDPETVTVGVIQGNVPSTGLAALGPVRTTVNNSLAETIALAAKAKTGQTAAPDFILWPESSTDTDPEHDEKTARLIKAAADLAGVPLLIGTLTYGPGEDERRTSAAWWSVEDGITDSYDKKNIVPFGEWIPARGFFLPRIPELKLIGRQTVPGTAAGVVEGQLADGRSLRIGTLICFEVGYDDTVGQAVLGDAAEAGSNIIVVQTNNSALTGTGQMAQQDAITQIRAMETRRDIVVATTNSLAGVIDAHGRHVWQAEPERSASASFVIPLRSAVTPAVAYRRQIEAALVFLPVLACAALAWRRRSGATARGAEERPALPQGNGGQQAAAPR
ncbi:MAG: apolipoprotein N-acyltransferase [Propionibacteriaceae bacterium]|jgi:apolipoprotein N-acyltransferase|nr:apolipoprotein N-acyltransferase [Propionibacteriaceae bacterium]